jgi:hypothetical protein
MASRGGHDKPQRSLSVLADNITWPPEEVRYKPQKSFR